MWDLVRSRVNKLTTATVRKLTQKRHNVRKKTLHSDPNPCIIKMDYMQWQKYDTDTWAFEWNDIERLALIKETKNGAFTLLVGTVTDAEYVSSAETLSDAQAKCMRYMILIKNQANVKVLKYLI